MAFDTALALEIQALDHDTRGRKRDRSVSRTRLTTRPMRAAKADDASTLRGRSRQRAPSPSTLSLSLSSGTSTPILVSSHHTGRIRGTRRREHCPSRPASPSRQGLTARRKQRSARSRSRGARRVDGEKRVPLVEHLSLSMSSLRNEVLVDEAAPDEAKTEAS